MAPKKKVMKDSGKSWELKPFTAKESATWNTAVASVRKHLKTKKRQHPALFMVAAVGKHLYEAAQELYKKTGKKGWELKPFAAKETAAWKAAVASAQKQLKAKRREHPALFMLAAVGKHLYDAPRTLYTKAPAKPMKKGGATKGKR
mmetsp:Transcript_100995/g.284829  ORF Transcript_100995/g.284829 Transcript_100995/m.284829 type:complete len:146 (+) Transcript_100995:83-520(+)